jgi:hypothetical protein
MRTTPEKITTLAPDEIFVFGSNLAGRHGKGAARDALKFGAVTGVGTGLAGRTYAIATKGFNLEVLPLKTIGMQVSALLNVAEEMPDYTFLVTPIGCGLAGYSPDDIAPMFWGYSANVILPKSFHEVMGKSPKSHETCY